MALTFSQGRIEKVADVGKQANTSGLRKMLTLTAR
jgi:hypothetical protein